MRNSVKLTAIITAAILMTPLAPANAVAEVNASIGYLYANAGTSVGAGGNYSSSIPDGLSMTISYDWYSCTTKTTFATTRSNLWTPQPGDVTTQDITDALAANGCTAIQLGAEWGILVSNFYNNTNWNATGIKPYVTGVQHLKSDNMSYPVQALADGYRLVEASATPTLTKNGEQLVATDGTYVTDEKETGDWTSGSYYLCDSPVSAGGFIWSEYKEEEYDGTVLEACKRLYGPWTGWDADYLEETTFDLNADYTNSEPVDENTPPAIIDLNGKYVVRAVNANSVSLWSDSVRIGEEVVAEPVTAQKKIYFELNNSKLSARQLATLKTWVNLAKSSIGEAQLTVNIKAYTQGYRKNGANKSLGLGRANAIKKALHYAKLGGNVTASYAGPSRVAGAKGRYAVVTLSWTPIDER